MTTPLTSIRDADRVEVIATNPPFGGEEEEGILNNFPQGLRTKETAILFFQYIMARLKRSGGRCGVVLPNGFLFGTGVAAEVKKQLLPRFNLHTVVGLPEGVFQPYTNIPTNVFFFEAGTPDVSGWSTKEIWYYEHPLPEGRKYSKTKPLEFDELTPLIAWWDRRENVPGDVVGATVRGVRRGHDSPRGFRGRSWAWRLPDAILHAVGLLSDSSKKWDCLGLRTLDPRNRRGASGRSRGSGRGAFLPRREAPGPRRYWKGWQQSIPGCASCW